MPYIVIKANCLDPTLAKELRTVCYAALDAGYEKQNVFNILTDPQVRHIGETIVDLFWRMPIATTVATDLGQDFALWLDFTTLRRRVPGANYQFANWHFDANFFGHKTTGITAWIPLDAVGETAPGLDICVPSGPSDPQALIEFLKKTSTKDTFEERDLKDLYPNQPFQIVTPRLQLGDLVLFDSHVAHRTQEMENRSTERLAIEFRLTPMARPNDRIVKQRFGTLSYRTANGDYVVRPYDVLYPELAES